MSTPILSTIEALEVELGIDSGSADALLTALLRRASSRFLTLIRRDAIHYEEGIVDDLPGGGQELIVSRTPLLAVTSVKPLTLAGVAGDALDASAYWITAPGAGLLCASSGVWSSTRLAVGARPDPIVGTERPAWRVTYTGGWVTPQQADDDPGLTRTLPEDIEDAVLAMAAALYNDQGRDLGVASEALLSGRVTYRERRALDAAVGSSSDVVRAYMRRS